MVIKARAETRLSTLVIINPVFTAEIICGNFSKQTCSYPPLEIPFQQYGKSPNIVISKLASQVNVNWPTMASDLLKQNKISYSSSLPLFSIQLFKSFVNFNQTTFNFANVRICKSVVFLARRRCFSKKHWLTWCSEVSEHNNTIWNSLELWSHLNTLIVFVVLCMCYV